MLMNRRGFSLLEVLVAAALVFCLLTGTAEIIVHSIWTKRTADGRFRAAASLASKLERMRALPFDGADLSPGTCGFEVSGEPGEPAVNLEWQITAMTPNIKKIEMLAFCNDRDRGRETGTRAVLFLSRHLGF
jgi:Tfp pilus assembly protein PilV